MPKGVSRTYDSKKRSEVTKRVWCKKGHRQKVAKSQQKTFATVEYHERQSVAQKKRRTVKRREVQSKKISKAWSGKKAIWSKGIKKGNTEDVKLQKSKARKANMKDPNYASAQISKTLACKKMSSAEKQFRTLLRLLELPYEFVGDGKLMIGRYCPDFVRVDAKAIIEIYGYHHGLSANIIHDKKRNRFIKRRGYEMLIVEAKELNDLDSLIVKVKQFDERILNDILYTSKTQAPSKKKVKV